MTLLLQTLSRIIHMDLMQHEQLARQDALQKAEDQVRSISFNCLARSLVLALQGKVVARFVPMWLQSSRESRQY